MTWAGSGKFNTTYNVKSIYYCAQKMERYWDVQFVQDTKRPEFIINLSQSNGPKAGAVAWVTGKTIHISRTWNFRQNDKIGGQALVHEFGHIFGGSSHAPQGLSIMSPVLIGPYANFTSIDANWFKVLPWRNASLRPWNEPNYWVPKGYQESYDILNQEMTFGCGSSWLYNISEFFNRRSILEIE
jgi:hypothetical protein